MKYLALLGVLLLAFACGSKSDRGGFVAPETGGAGGRMGAGGAGRSSAGKSADSAAGEGGEAGDGTGETEGNPLAPIVMITSPEPVSDPDTGPVVLEQVRVICRATKGSAPTATFAGSSVSIEAFDAKGKSIQKTTGTQNVQDPTEFFSDFTLTPGQAPNGAISFRCSASDTSNPPLTTSSVVNTFIDHGPTITVMNPALPVVSVLDYYALGVVPFRFSVAPYPLADGDSQAKVKTVTLAVNNIPIDLSKAEDKAHPGTYKIDINLADPIAFKVVPNGATSVSITATNIRKPLPVDHPDPVTSKLNYDFGIDGAGPKITITSPSVVDPPVLGRQVKLTFTVADGESGVDPSTVNVQFNAQESHAYDPSPAASWEHSGDNYTFTITDTTSVQGSKFQLSVSIDAQDKAKNKALTATAQYWLDTSSPTIDLDPPRIVEVKKTSGQDYCSAPFDPLGQSPSDGQTIPAASIFRALVWDQTNRTDGSQVLHYAGIDPTSVRLYAQPVTSQSLLIAAHNEDGVCDEIATDGMPNVVHAPIPFQLSPLDLAPGAFYGSDADDQSVAVPNLCKSATEATRRPDQLCKQHNSDMYYVIDHGLDVKEDVIYTLTSSVGAECTGRVLDLSASVPNGWVCLAARAVDRAGNVGISAPIRVCLNAAGHPAPECATSSVEPPSCLGACTPPKHFLGADPASPVPYVRLAQ